MMVLLLITLITCVRMYALFSHITSSLCLSITKRSASSAKLSSRLPPSTSLRPIIARSSPLSGILSSLSSTHHRKIKSFIRDTDLSTLRKQSRKAWERWRSAGRPREGTLYVDKRDSKKNVRQYVAMCRAREERAKIQARDTLFSENSRNRIESSNLRVCKGLRINENICTSPQEIAGRFRDYYKELATSSQSSTLTEVESTIPDLEVSSFLNCENILDSEIDLEEIECALKALKLGKSGGIDSLDPEHICFGGETLRLWLKKIFNRIIALEQIPTSLNEGLIIPVHKEKGKDPFKSED